MFLFVLWMILNCFCINAQDMLPCELHAKIAAFLMGCDEDHAAVNNFYQSGLRKQSSDGYSKWSANTAWSVLGFCQVRPMKSFYANLSTAETMSLTQEQRRVLKAVFQTKDESYDYNVHTTIDRDMFTSISIYHEDFAILNSCPLKALMLLFGTPTKSNIHHCYSQSVNLSKRSPACQYILVNLYKKVYIKKANPDACTHIDVEKLANAVLHAKPLQCLQSIKNTVLSYLSTIEISYYKEIPLVLMFKENNKLAYEEFRIEYPYPDRSGERKLCIDKTYCEVNCGQLFLSNFN